MKIECVKRIIDMELIRKIIFTSEEEIKYLVMNENTLKDIKNCYAEPIYENKTIVYGTIYGVPIATCNILADGYIDFIGEK